MVSPGVWVCTYSATIGGDINSSGTMSGRQPELLFVGYAAIISVNDSLVVWKFLFVIY